MSLSSERRAPEVSEVATRQAEMAPHAADYVRPGLPVPAGTTDCHHHIFDPRFRKTDGSIMLTVATADDYRRLRCRLGIARSVVVAAASFGEDDSGLIDALGVLGETARGVAILPPNVSEMRLCALDAAGVRGARFYLEKHKPPTADALAAFARRAAAMGWHVEIMPSRGEALVAAEVMLAGLACPVVIDHFGYTPQPAGTAHPAFDTLRRLMDGGGWVKLSGAYFTSHAGLPDCEDVDALAAALIAHRPDRVLWGTDWPHSGAKAAPDDARLLERTALWAPDEATRRDLLTRNPAALYWEH